MRMPGWGQGWQDGDEDTRMVMGTPGWGHWDGDTRMGTWGWGHWDRDEDAGMGRPGWGRRDGDAFRGPPAPRRTAPPRRAPGTAAGGIGAGSSRSGAGVQRPEHPRSRAASGRGAGARPCRGQ